MDAQTETELLSFTAGSEEGGASDRDVASADSDPMVEAMPSEFTAGATRFTGKFFRTPGIAGYSGEGRVAWPNGDVYEGRLVRGARDGAGVFTWSNGQRDQVGWVQDRPQGKGNLRFVNGDIYDGDIDAGVPHGDGTMAYGSGDRYEGRLADGVPYSAGSYVWPTARRCGEPGSAARRKEPPFFYLPTAIATRANWHQVRPPGRAESSTSPGMFTLERFAAASPTGRDLYVARRRALRGALESRTQARTRNHHLDEWRSLARDVRQRPAGRRHDDRKAGLRSWSNASRCFPPGRRSTTCPEQSRR